MSESTPLDGEDITYTIKDLTTLKCMAEAIAQEQIETLEYLSVVQDSDSYGWDLTEDEARYVYELALQATVTIN